MPLFLGVHDFGGALTGEQIDEAWSKYNEAAKKHGAHAKGLYYNGPEGRSFCVTEAESADVVNAAHADAGYPTKELFQVNKLKSED